MTEDLKFWCLLRVCIAMVLNLKAQGRLLMKHDEILRTIVHGDPDAELAAMSPVHPGMEK
jgi:hypothetical protein